MKSILLFSFSLLLVIVNSYGQEQRTCASYEVMQDMMQKYPEVKANVEANEAFIQQWLLEHTGGSNQKTESAVITIPVVVHVIHFGEAVGTGANISENQVLSQIVALNEDFRKLNGDQLSGSHPFAAYTADAQLEFCMAKRTPAGAATNGIERINGGKSSWTKTEIENTLKPATIWDRNKYLNVWTVTFGGSDAGLLGYATWPGSTASNDGVVIRYNSYGYVDNVDPPFDYGRTAVHEIGHWFNLRHIWGDNQPNCGDDLVSDTKPAYSPNFNCPSFPNNANNGCGTDANGDMFMNFMDYVDDACMVMFTTGQANRMQATLNSSRSSLKTSNGCLTVGLEEQELLSTAIQLYPNPNSGSFNVAITNPLIDRVGVSVYNLLGEKVYELADIPNLYQIVLPDASNGIYTVKITWADKEYYQKVIVAK